MRQRPNSDDFKQTSYRGWLGTIASPKDDAGHLVYPASGRDTAKSGIGCEGKCHLNYLAESIFVNVGDSYGDVKLSSPTRLGMRVGAAIVVRGWESQPQGEGPQAVNNSLVES
ncbi:MAG: hypothetical protein ACREBC_20700 [Pyrinomonadaceae bacterium]